MGFQTDCTSTGDDRERQLGSVAPPIYESSLFTFPTYAAFSEAFDRSVSGDADNPVYTRGTNPTVRALEKKVALLEGGEDARAFASGMAAIAASILHAARAGEHVVAVQSIYSNAFRLLHSYLPTLGVGSTFADFTDLSSVERAIRPNTKVLYMETPGNPGMHLVDLEAAVRLARDRGLVTIVDNTMATPYNQRPLEWGVDLVVHSATKYLGGHSDVVAGIAVGNRDRMRSLSENEIRDLGGILGPFEAWLILRGIRTLGLRMRAANETGMRVARWLQGRPEIERVLYPGLESHPQHDLACRQMQGFGSLLSIVLDGDLGTAAAFVDRLQLFGIAVSWGGFESLALPINPASSLTADVAQRVGLVPGMVRLSLGLEDADDLIADLARALDGVRHVRTA